MQVSDGENTISSSRRKCGLVNCQETFDTTKQLTRHQNYKCGKTKQFQCTTCQRSFYLRIGLMNHFKKSTCQPQEGLNDDQ